uniref:AI-2E family transporter n=1 Tax=uncultured Massilia sp. TaxID=169973 RepID=UPI00258BEE7A
MQLVPPEPAQPAQLPDNAAPAAPAPSGPGAASEPASGPGSGPAPHGDELTLHAGALRLPVHVNARGLSLGILATIACVFALQWAQKFFVPLLLGIFIAYTLNPVVRWLERWHVKRVIGATLVTAIILGAMGGTFYR